MLFPLGLFARPNTAQMFACRGGAMLATLIAIVGGAVTLLLGHLS